MRTDTVDKLIWWLIYAGLLLACLGLFVQRAHDPIGWIMIVLGAAMAVGGAVLVWVRSRMNDND